MRAFSITVAFVLLVLGPVCVDAAMNQAEGADLITAPAEMQSMKVGTQAQQEAARMELVSLHQRLMSQRVELGTKSPIRVELSQDQLKALAAPSYEQALRVGIVTEVGASVSLGEMLRSEITEKASPRRVGAVRRVGRDMVWTSAVTSPGAKGIRLEISGLDLSPGIELAIYNARGEAFAYELQGPNGNGSFWSNTVTGDTAYLQLSGADLSGISFEITELGYLGDSFVYGAHAGSEKAFCSYNASCVQNAGCGINQAAADATNAVAYMLYVQKPWMYACSGGLINNASGRPYFLTANHCISKDRAAATLEAYFFFEIGCNDSCPEEWSEPSTPRTLGSSVVSTNKSSDYTILELSQAAPAGSVLLGWNSTDVAFNDGFNLYRISHPATAPQAYSTHVVDTSKGVCSSWPRGAWIYSHDTYGATEGGSSGSPVVNSSGQIVGQLSGGCGTNVYDVCDSESNATVDGAFAAYYSAVAGILN